MSSISLHPSPSSSLKSPNGFARDLLEVLLLILLGTSGVLFSQVYGPTTLAGNIIALGGILAMLSLALLAPRLRHEPISVIGIRRISNWKWGLVKIAGATLAVSVISSFFERWVLPLVEVSVADNSRFEFIEGKPEVFIGTLVVMWITAAFAEEVIFRGFLMSRLARLMGGGRGAWVGALALSSLLFSLIHIYQGTGGVIRTGLMGLLLGLVYLLSHRNLWIAIGVHGLTNTLALTILFMGLGKG